MRVNVPFRKEERRNALANQYTVYLMYPFGLVSMLHISKKLALFRRWVLSRAVFNGRVFTQSYASRHVIDRSQNVKTSVGSVYSSASLDRKCYFSVFHKVLLEKNPPFLQGGFMTLYTLSNC